MKPQRRSILHVDLEAFFVAVERSLDPALRNCPLVIGGDDEGLGIVAAASVEARQAGVRVGSALVAARRLCPEAVFRRGDLHAYGRVSEEVTAVLLAASRRLERPSADEAFVDLTPDPAFGGSPVRAAETIRDELQRRLGLDASLGLASSRLAARIASGWARPRGLLVVLPGYEPSFLSSRPVRALELPLPLETALARAGIVTLGQLASADVEALAAVTGRAAAARLKAAARAEGESPIALAAPPAFVQEEWVVRDRHGDADALAALAATLARRAARRLKPLRLVAGALTVEVRRAGGGERRSEALRPGLSDEETIASAAGTLASTLLQPAAGVRTLLVRLARLQRRDLQAPLFPATPERRQA